MPVAKDTVMKNFHQIPDSDGQWKCVCGKDLSQKNISGFTNLLPVSRQCLKKLATFTPRKFNSRRNTSKHAEIELGHSGSPKRKH